MNRPLAPLAALTATAAPLLPVLALGIGAFVLLGCLFSEHEPTTKPSEATPERPPPPPKAPGKPRQTSGRFAPKVGFADVERAFAAGPLTLTEAVSDLQASTGCSRSAAYHILTKRFASSIRTTPDGRLTIRAYASQNG